MYDARPIVNAGRRKWNAIRNANWMRERNTGSSSMVLFPVGLARELRCQPPVRAEPPLAQLAAVGCGLDRAAWLLEVQAIAKAALAEPRPELDERVRRVLRR